MWIIEDPELVPGQVLLLGVSKPGPDLVLKKLQC